VVPLIDEAGVARVVIVRRRSKASASTMPRRRCGRHPGRFAHARIALEKRSRAPTRDLAPAARRDGRSGSTSRPSRRMAQPTAPRTGLAAAEKAQIPIMFLTAGQTAEFAVSRSGIRSFPSS